MNTKELRIGNFVVINNSKYWPENFGKTLTVYGVEERHNDLFPKSKAVVTMSKELDVFSQFEEFVDPIPLTEDWLLNFGFIDDDDDFLIDISEQESIHINLHKKRFLIEGYNGIVKLKEVYFVHQLQNLYFSLMGEELRIKNK